MTALTIILLMVFSIVPTGSEGAIITDAYPNNGDVASGIRKFYMQDMGFATSAEMYVDGVFFALMQRSIPPWEWEATVDTRGWADGYHVVTYKSFGGGSGNDARSYSILFDNSPPAITQAQIIYPSGLTAAKNLSKVRISAHIQDALRTVTLTKAEISDINTSVSKPTYVLLYDDGLHGDQAAGDKIYGTDLLAVRTPSGIKSVSIIAMDDVGNNGSVAIPVQVDNYQPLIRKVNVVYPPGQTSAKVGDEIRILADIDDTNFIYVQRSTPGPVDIAIAIDNSDTLKLTQWLPVEDAVSLFVDSLSDSSRISLWGSTISGSREDVRMLIPFTTLGNSAQDPIDGYKGTGRDVIKHMVKADDGLHFTYKNGTPGGFSPAWDLIGESAAYVINNFQVGSTPGVIPMLPTDDFGPGGKQSGSETFAPGAYKISGSNSAFSSWWIPEGCYWGDGGNRYYDEVARLTRSVPQAWDPLIMPDEPNYTGLIGIPIPMMTISYLLPVQGVNPGLPGYISPSAVQNGAPSYVNPAAKAYGFTVDYDLLRIAQTSPNGRHYYSENAAALAIAFQDIRNKLAMISTQPVGMDAPHGVIEFGANLSSMGYPYLIQMYDDGMHDDGFAGDSVFGTGLVKVGIHDTRKELISVFAKDIAGNTNMTQALVNIDNEPPRVENILPHYLYGKNAVRDGDRAYASALVSDMGSVSGILDVFLEPSPVSPRVRMLDDGKGNDAAANDWIYTSSNFTVPLGAPNGKNTLTVSGLDGSYQLTLGYGTILVDNPPPSIRILSPLEGAYLNANAQIWANISDERQYTTPTYSIDGGPWATMVPVINKPYNYSAPLDIAPLNEGRHNLSIRTTDSSGNLVIKVLNFTADKNKPVISPQFPKGGSVISGNATVKVWAWDSIGIHNVSFTLGSIASIPLAYNAVSGLYEGTLNTLLFLDGNYSAWVAAKDLSGWMNTTKMIITVDNTAPDLKLLAPIPGAVVHDNVTILVNVTDVTAVDVTYSVGQIGEKGLQTQWNTTEISDGTYTLTIKARDLAGHVTLISILVTVDNHNPIILPLSLPEEAQHISGVVTVKAKVEDITLNVTSLSLSTQYGQYLICADYERSFECNIDTSARTEGNYTLILRAEDKAGHYAVIARNVTLDNSPPGISINPKAIEVLTGDVTFRVKAFDASPQVELWFMIDNGTWGLMSFDAKRGEYIYIWHTMATDNGRHAIKVRAIDAIGNEKVYQFEYVVDNMQWGWVYLMMVLVLISVIAALLRRDVEIEEVIEESTPQIVVVQQPVLQPQPQAEGEESPRKGIGGVLTRIATRRRRDITPAKELIKKKEEETEAAPEEKKTGPAQPEGAKPRRTASPEERKKILRERAAERRARMR